MENIRNGDVFAIKYPDGMSIDYIIIVTDYLNRQFMKISYDENYDCIYYFRNRDVDKYLDINIRHREFIGHIDGNFTNSIFDNEAYKAIMNKFNRKLQICSSNYCMKIHIKFMLDQCRQKEIIRDKEAIYHINNFKEVLDKTRKEINDEERIIDVNYSPFKGALKTIGRIVDFSDDYEYAHVFISDQEIRKNINPLKAYIDFTLKYSIDYEFENIQFRHIEEIRYSQLLEGGN